MVNPHGGDLNWAKTQYAGEILDCDAYTGGFNLQIAWATAYAAGSAAAERGGK